jgi:carbon monoxide dehydrogenase subunit G
MDMKGEQLIPAPQADVWQALNDPAVLRACVPGCESIDLVANNEYMVLMVARVGPVSAKFKGRLMLSDIKPPVSYSLAFDGQGGPAGFAKGGATVRLAAQGEQTLLAYDVKASVGGKLAQIGSRLIDAAAKKVADEFFGNFTRKFTGEGDADQTVIVPAAKEQPAAHAAPAAAAPAAPSLSDLSVTFFAAGALVVFLVSLIVFLG